MLDETQREAIALWYAQPDLLVEVRRLHDAGAYEELEGYLHRTCLLSIGQHDTLPDHMRDVDGKTLFPTNLNPAEDDEGWQDAIEIGWQVVEAQLGISHDDIHRAIAAEQQDEWQTFLKSVEKRRKERGS